MGAGVSTNQPAESKTIQRTIIVAPSSPERLHNRSDEEGYSPMLLDTKVASKWQWEEETGRWTDLQTSVGDRIEAAFKESRPNATCTMNNRIATVDLKKMVLALGGSNLNKNVRRVATTGPQNKVDPFAVCDEPATPILVSPEDGDDDGQFEVDLQSVIYAHNAPVFTGGFSAEGDTILTGAKDGTMKHWEVQSSFLRREFEVLEGSVLTVAMSKTAPLAASGSDDKMARLYSLDKSSSPKEVLVGHSHKVYGVNFTRDGRTITTTSMDCTLRTWDVNTLTNTRTIECHTSSIFSQAVSPLSPWLVLTASDDHTLASHDLRVGSTEPMRRYIGHTKTLWGCDIRYDEMQYISCGMDGNVLLWDPRRDDLPLKAISSHTNSVHCVEYLPDGRHFLSSGRDMSFKITDAITGATSISRRAHDGHVFKVTYNAMKDTIMTCGADASVKLWSLKRRL